jgi:hypothetical protein
MEFRRFLYWLPGQAALNDDALAKLGLANALPAASTLARRGADPGPDGGRGNVVGIPAPAGAEESPFGFYPDEQVWRRCGLWWLGVTKGRLPRPEDLARKQQVRGHWVKLGDGNGWLVPAAVRYDLETGTRSLSLPAGLDLSDEGQWVTRPLPRFAFFSEQVELAWTFYAKRLADPTVEIDPDLWLDLAVQALAFNYHVGKWELASLGLLSTASVHEIVEAVLDVPTMLAVAEAHGKKAAAQPAGSPTDSGERAG